jgi:hypothetical protein
VKRSEELSSTRHEHTQTFIILMERRYSTEEKGSKDGKDQPWLLEKKEKLYWCDTELLIIGATAVI